MEIKVVAGDIAKTKADAIIVPFFEGMERPEGDIAAIDKALDGATLTEACRVTGPTIAGWWRSWHQRDLGSLFS